MVVGSQIPGWSESQRAAQATKEELCGKEQPDMPALGVVRTQLEGLAAPFHPRVSTCEGGLRRACLGVNIGPAPSGKEGVCPGDGCVRGMVEGG